VAWQIKKDKKSGKKRIIWKYEDVEKKLANRFDNKSTT